MIALVGGPRSVAVVKIRADGSIAYRSVKSSKGVVIGNLPYVDPMPENEIVSLVARKPAFRRPFVAVEYISGSVYVAQLNARRMELGKWKHVDVGPGMPILARVRRKRR